MFNIANKYECQVPNKYQYTQDDNLDPNSMFYGLGLNFEQRLLSTISIGFVQMT